MKNQLSFYPSKLEACGFLIAAFLYGGMVFCNLPGALFGRILSAAVFCVFLLIGLKKLFFPAPLCTLTLQEIRFDVHGKSVRYAKIVSFHTRLEPGFASTYGGIAHVIDNLGFRITGEELYIFPAHRLSDKDRARLIEELKKRRVKYTGKEFDPTTSIPFARFFRKRKK